MSPSMNDPVEELRRRLARRHHLIGWCGLLIFLSVGGFLEIGSISTAAQGGASFHFELIWAILLGGLCLIFLVEQSGRLAAVSRHTITDAIRERFGFGPSSNSMKASITMP